MIDKHVRAALARMSETELMIAAEKLLKLHIADHVAQGLAEDALHAACLTIALEGLQVHHGPSALGAWLMKIGTDLAKRGDTVPSTPTEK